MDVSFAHGTRKGLEQMVAKHEIVPFKCEIYLDIKTGRLFFVHDEVETKLTKDKKNDIISLDMKIANGYISFEELAQKGLEGTF